MTMVRKYDSKGTYNLKQITLLITAKYYKLKITVAYAF